MRNRRTRPLYDGVILAEEAGIEPTHYGFKVHCLTIWLFLNILTSLLQSIFRIHSILVSFRHKIPSNAKSLGYSSLLRDCRILMWLDTLLFLYTLFSFGWGWWARTTTLLFQRQASYLSTKPQFYKTPNYPSDVVSPCTSKGDNN